MSYDNNSKISSDDFLYQAEILADFWIFDAVDSISNAIKTLQNGIKYIDAGLGIYSSMPDGRIIDDLIFALKSVQEIAQQRADFWNKKCESFDH